ncbi:hypothetical protein BH23ACT9_BH23ACT9_07940 [soil metagenome]
MAGTTRTAAPDRGRNPLDAGPLYERVLGPRAAALHPQVAALHRGASDVRAEGWMHVTRGDGLRCRIAAAAARLPAPGTHVRIRLAITRDEDEERWVRQFGDTTAMVSRQTAGRAGELLERVGLLTFVFTLHTDGDLLRFDQGACQVRLAGLVLVIPPRWAPEVVAVVGPAPEGGVAVSVRIQSRWAGLLLGYDGTVAVQERSR